MSRIGGSITAPRPALDRADHVIRALRRAEGSVAGEDVHALVNELTHALPAHFESEERPGGLFDALERAGALLTLSTLCTDHEAFRATLRRLDDAVRFRDGSAPALLSSLALRLRSHERLEAAAARKLGVSVSDPPEPATRPEVTPRRRWRSSASLARSSRAARRTRAPWSCRCA